MFLRSLQGTEKRNAELARLQVLGRGGAGTIYQDPENDQQALKIYHTHFLDAHTHLQAKLESMLASPPGDEEIWAARDRYVQIAWPSALVEDHRGKLLGYIMPVVDMKRAVVLEQVLQKAERRRAQIREDYRFRMYVGRNLAGALWKLHAKGHAIVDLKPVNVLVYQKTGFVCLLDCDGYDVQGKGHIRYRADLFTAEYLLPEGHTGKLRPDQLDPLEQDRFALAVILFQLMNNGLHPYQGRPIGTQAPPSIAERIAEGLYSYGKTQNPHQEPSTQTIHPFFKEETRDLFDRAFEKGSNRPSALEWLQHFDSLISGLQQCSVQIEHQHFGKGCGWCALSAANPQVTKPPKRSISNTVRQLFRLLRSLQGHCGSDWLKRTILATLLLVVSLGISVQILSWLDSVAVSPPKPLTPLSTPATPAPLPVVPNATPLVLPVVPLSVPPLVNTLPADPKKALIPPSFDPAMVLIPAGTLQVAQHTIQINAFYMGKYAVTFEEYDRFAKATQRTPPMDQGWGRGNRPVIDVSWWDAMAYAEWLSQQTGKAYRLPTEGEWEYAAQAGTTTAYYWGSDIGWNHANCDQCGSVWDHKQTAPVGSFAPNPWGLYDMLGNVLQWTCSAWADPRNESAQECQTTGDTNRVYRGGSWFEFPTRTTTRRSLTPTSHSSVLGFRVVRALGQSP